jgi:hypothetical protein
VDHDHAIGGSPLLSVRGLLCIYCNKYVLGNAKAWTPDTFRRAADYLENPPGAFGHPPNNSEKELDNSST